MARMMVHECGPLLSNRVRFYLVIGAAVILLNASLLSARVWNRVAAERAFEEAKRVHAALRGEKSRPSRERYLHCIRAYQEVYLRDPHYGGSDDAAYEAGKLYQAMGEVFGDQEFYALATKLFSFLVSDYPASPNCPDALLRMGDLYAGPLGDENLAREAYEKLRKRYKSSPAAAKVASMMFSPPEIKSLPVKPPGQAEAGSVAAHPVNEQNTLSSVYGIRHWSTSNYTRVSIDLDSEARFQKTRLTDPDRIFFDIYSSKLTPDLLNKTFAVGDQFLKQVRVGQNRLDVVRVVLDFAGVTDYSVFELHDPFRIIIDIQGATASAQEKVKRPPRAIQPKPHEITEAKNTALPLPASATAPAPSSTTGESSKGEPAPGLKTKPEDSIAEVRETVSTRESTSKKTQVVTSIEKTVEDKKAAVETPPAPSHPSEPPVLRASTPTSRGDRTMTRILGLKIGRIVLDPGHGGHDTGTIGPGGLKEKDLVMQVAKRLQRLLEERLGAEVVLTRTDDTFVPLEDRTALANQHQADLFVSIHANASRSRSASGVETYYLNFARSDEAREVAARENASTIRNIRDLQDLVRKIAQADKSTESRELAALLQKKLFVGARKVYPSARDRGVRSAPFVVLIGANMPSVLAEVGFISNPRDERILRKEDNRHRLAEALFAGIEGYMKTLGSDVAQNQSN